MLEGLPPELLTMGLTGAMTAAIRLKTLSMKYEKEKFERALKGSEAATVSHDAADKRGGSIASKLRAFIIFAMMLVFVFPTIAPLLLEDVPVYLTYYEENRKIFGFFGNLADKLKVVEIDSGIVVDPNFRHMIAAVFGYMFGAGSVKA